MLVLLLTTCKKDFLDVRPDKALLVPATLADMRALLDNNLAVFNQSPALTTVADGDTYTTDAGFNAYVLDEERKSYIWAADIFGNVSAGDWNIPYKQIFYANVVLEGLGKISPPGAEQAEYNAVKGTALFYRAFAYYNLMQQFAPPYRAASAATDKGVPIRLTSGVGPNAVRSSVAATYEQVLTDLRNARALLPASTAFKTRPPVAGAMAMLARVYLVMGDYARAGRYADSCLQQNPALINYNTLSTTATRPFVKALPNSNDEIVFYSIALSYGFGSSTSPTVADPALYASYAANDLRKVIFFRALAPGFKFKGNYAGIIAIFSGIATDELYFIRAECAARLGNTAAALADLNKVLITRWKTGTYVTMNAATPEDALKLILMERRKELTGRGTRWTDLRRLNDDPRFALTLSRKVLGNTYTLEPGSKRYTYPIPLDELRLNALEQNER